MRDCKKNKVLVSELCGQRCHSETNPGSVVYTPKPIVQVLYIISQYVLNGNYCDFCEILHLVNLLELLHNIMLNNKKNIIKKRLKNNQ